MRLKPSIPLQSMSFGNGKQPMEHEKKEYVSLYVVRSGETERGGGAGVSENFYWRFGTIFKSFQSLAEQGENTFKCCLLFNF